MEAHLPVTPIPRTRPAKRSALHCVSHTPPSTSAVVATITSKGKLTQCHLEVVVEALRAELREMDAGCAVTQMEARSCPASKGLRSVTAAW